MEKIYQDFFKKDENEEHSIAPSKEFVNNLLRQCARELGVEFNPEEEKKKPLFSEEQEKNNAGNKRQYKKIKIKSKITNGKFF